MVEATENGQCKFNARQQTNRPKMSAINIWTIMQMRLLFPSHAKGRRFNRRERTRQAWGMALNKKANGRVSRLRPSPGHARDTTEGSVCNQVECRGGEVKIGHFASDATVGNGHVDGLALVGRSDFLATDRVLVRVSSIVAWV